MYKQKKNPEIWQILTGTRMAATINFLRHFHAFWKKIYKNARLPNSTLWRAVCICHPRINPLLTTNYTKNWSRWGARCVRQQVGAALSVWGQAVLIGILWAVINRTGNGLYQMSEPAIRTIYRTVFPADANFVRDDEECIPYFRQWKKFKMHVYTGLGQSK